MSLVSVKKRKNGYGNSQFVRRSFQQLEVDKDRFRYDKRHFVAILLLQIKM